MTLKEIEKEFPIGSRVVYIGLFFNLRGKFAKVIGYSPIARNDYWLAVEWEDLNIEREWKFVLSWSSWNFQLISKPNNSNLPPHNGMIYNPLSKRWSWI